MQTNTAATQTIIKLEGTNAAGGETTTVCTQGDELHQAAIAKGLKEVARWEQWNCTTCGASADNNPQRAGDKIDLHRFRTGHLATR